LNYSVLLLKDVTTFVCGILSSILVARQLGPEIYGSYLFIMLIFHYFHNFVRFRTSVSILPYLKNNSAHEKTIFSLGFLISSLLSAISIILLFIIGYFFELFKNFSNLTYFFLSIMIVSESILVYATYALMYQSKFKYFAGINIFRQIVQTSGFAYIFFFQPDKAILPYLGVYSMTGLMTAIFSIFFVRTFINNSFLNYKELDLRYYLKTSLKFYFTDFINFFSNKAIATFVAAKFSFSNLAFFNILFSHFEMLRFPNSAIGTIMYPALSKEKSEQKQRDYIKSKIWFNLLIYPPILVVAYFLYPKLVLLMYGPEYEILTKYFKYILLAGTPYLIAYPVVHYFSSNGAPQYEGLVIFISLSIQLVSVLLFNYIVNFTLFNAVISQSIGFIGFTIGLFILYNSISLAPKQIEKV